MKQGNSKHQISTNTLKQVTDSLCIRFHPNKPISSKNCDPIIPDDCIVPQHQMHLSSSPSVSQRLSDNFGNNQVASAGISLPLISDNTIGGEDHHQSTSSSDWITGPWSACFKSGTNSIQIREVSCPSDRRCREHRPMNSRACGVWFTGEWSNCNSTCEHRVGHETREVKCIQSNGERSSYSHELAELDCLHPKPDNIRTCTSYCKQKGRWRTGPWGKV
jgi:hypothetical protein